MASGIIAEFDVEKRQGYLIPDSDSHEEMIPFELDEDSGLELRSGDHVTYEVEGGFAGIMATHVRKV